MTRYEAKRFKVNYDLCGPLSRFHPFWGLDLGDFACEIYLYFFSEFGNNILKRSFSKICLNKKEKQIVNLIKF